MATIPNFREQIGDLQSKLKDSQAQNESLLEFSTQISQLTQTISNRDQMNQTNQQLRDQIS